MWQAVMNTGSNRPAYSELIFSWYKSLDRLLLAAVVVTFLNGLVFSLLVFPRVSGPAELQNYGDGWAQVAESVAHGNGFVFVPVTPNQYMRREPAYALFLASILLIFGKLGNSMMLFQSIINSTTCLVLYFIARKTFDRRVGLTACFLYAFYPFASWYVPRIGYETLLGLFVALLTLGVINLFSDLSFRRALILGLLLGITVLCRGLFLLLPLALLPGLLIRFNLKDVRVYSCWAVIVIIMTLVLSPWVIRNYLLSREFVPTTTAAGMGFLIGNKLVEYYSLQTNTAGKSPDKEVFRLYSDVHQNIRSQHPDLSDPQLEVQTDRELARMARAGVISDPVKFIKKILKGLFLVWFLSDTSLKSTALFLMQIPLLLAGIAGVYCARRQGRQILPLLIILIYFVAVQTAFSALGRYSYPMTPILITFAAYALSVLAAASRMHRLRRTFARIFRMPVRNFEYDG